MRLLSKPQYDAITNVTPKVKYRLYRMTYHWRNKRNEVYTFYHGRCSHCKRKVELSKSNVHHINYNHKFNETPGVDVTLLCVRCHKKLHKIYGKKTTISHTFPKPKKTVPKPYSDKQQMWIDKNCLKDPHYSTMRQLLKDMESTNPQSLLKYDTNKLWELIEMLPNKRDLIISLMNTKRKS